ncbi:MAG: PEP-CTERM sorting domain-containing protein, partial [Planctomycetota bacterium]
YDGTELSLFVDSGGLVMDETASYTVDLSSSQSMYIRAVSNGGSQDTFLRNLQLDGSDVNGGTFSADNVADYLAIFDFDWSMPWSMTGSIDMEGNDAFPNSRPSIQWKLTNLVVPEPATSGLIGLALGLLGLASRRQRG